MSTIKVKLKDLDYFKSIGFITLNDIMLENGDDMILLNMPGTEFEVVETSNSIEANTGYKFNSKNHGFFIRIEWCSKVIKRRN